MDARDGRRSAATDVDGRRRSCGRGAQAGRAQGPPRAVPQDRRVAPSRRGCRSCDDAAGPLGRRRSTTRSRRRRSGVTRVVKGIALADYAALLDERATFMGQWGLRGSRGGHGHRPTRSSSRREGRPRLRYWLDRLADRERAARPPSCTATSRACPRATTWWSSTEAGQRRARPGSPSRASAGTGGCAWPTSSATRGLGRGRRRRLPPWSRSAQRISEFTQRSCSRPTPTATTSRCTACRCS